QTIVSGTPSHVYGMYGWACKGCGIDPAFQLAPQPATSGWVSHAVPPTMVAGGGGDASMAVTYDGTHYIIVAQMWLTGLWRYVENSPPVGSVTIQNQTVTPSTISNYANKVVTISCKAKSSSLVTNVSVNLSSLNGPAVQKMSNISGSTSFRYSFTVLAGVSGGTKTLQLSAKDNAGNQGSGYSVTLTVVSPPSGLIVTNVSVVPSLVTNNISHVIVINAKSTCLFGTVTNVSLDLTQIGGSLNTKM